jgi:hypothetical protein
MRSVRHPVTIVLALSLGASVALSPQLDPSQCGGE